jgi:hypothetical protein
MRQKITPDIVTQNFFSAVSDNTMQVLIPRKRTLLFLKQFACSYHVEKGMPLPLNAMILN